MKSFLVREVTVSLQDGLYDKLNKFSRSHAILGRFCAVPVSLLDVGLETLRTPLSAIHCVAMAAINLIGAAFSEKFTLKDVIFFVEGALGNALHTPIALAMAPIKLIFQFSVIIINPEKVNSINPFNPTFGAPPNPKKA